MASSSPRTLASVHHHRVLRQARQGRHGYTSGDEKTRGVVLYRDDAHWCPYCEKVQILLEEKQVPYVVKTVPMMCYTNRPKPSWFMEVQPSGMLPAAVVDNKRLGSSDDIMFYVEKKYTDVPMLPRDVDSDAAQRVPRLTRLEREFFSAWARWLTTRGNGFANGLRRDFETTLSRVERALPDPKTSRSAFFLGDSFRAGKPSMIDVTFAPFLERAAASLAYNKGFRMRGDGRYPRLERWFEAMEAVPAYRALRGDAYSHAYGLPPQMGGCPVDTDVLAREVEDSGVTNMRDGNVGWRLPLRRLNEADVDFTVFMKDEDMRVSKRHAAEALSSNVAAVARFATRGAVLGDTITQRYARAPLADPGAPELDAIAGPVQVALEAVVLALNEDTAQQRETYPFFDDGKDPATTARAALEPARKALDALAADDTRGGAPDDMRAARHEALLASLEYVSKRIGVPRDMGVAEARQLRAHLNWAIDGLKD